MGVQLLLNSFARTPRSASEVSSGCWVVFCSGITNLPFRPRALAASSRAGDFFRRQPRQLRLAVQHQRAASAPATSFCWKGVSSVAASLLIAFSRVLPASERLAPAWTN